MEENSDRIIHKGFEYEVQANNSGTCYGAKQGVVLVHASLPTGERFSPPCAIWTPDEYNSIEKAKEGAMDYAKKIIASGEIFFLLKK